jgi:hypothetical protein
VLRTSHGIAVLLLFNPFATFVVQADNGELVAQSEAYEVRLLGHEDRPHSVLRNPTVREYLFEATTRKDGQKVFITLGGDYLRALERLQETRIFEGRFVVTTHVNIFTFDLRSGQRLKFLSAIGPTSSPSGRYVAYREWQTRGMPEEAQGAIVSLLDLHSLERRAVYPVSGRLREYPPTKPDDEFELYFTNWEEDPRQRCFTSKLVWSADDSRIAFLCHYYLATQGRFPEHPELRELALVVVYPITDLKAAAPKRFNLEQEAFRIPGVETTERNFRQIDESSWLNEDVFEIRPPPKPWLRKRILINVTTGAIRSEP